MLMKPPFRISDLTDDQKGHMIWRIDHCTGTGLLTAMRCARGEFGNPTIEEVFRRAGLPDRRAKIAATKVRKFKCPISP